MSLTITTALSTCARFFTSVLIAALLACVFSSQFVIHGLSELNVAMGFSTRISMMIADLGALPSLMLVIAASFLVGFIVAAICCKKIGGRRTFWYVLAGASSLMLALLVLSWAFKLMPLAGARTLFGLLTQGVAGGIGGFCFARLFRKKTMT